MVSFVSFQNPDTSDAISPAAMRPARLAFPPRNDIAWFLLPVILVSVYFRIRALSNIPGLNGDEAWYGVKAMEILSGTGELTSLEFWKTPTQNFINPFFIGLQILLHSVFDPDVTVLRSAAVLSGMLVLPLNFWMCKKELGRTSAWFSTAVFAALPIGIAYSRFAWDASQTIAATVPIVYLSMPGLRGEFRPRNLVLLHLALLVAVIIHPTSVFLIPFVVGATAVGVYTRGIWTTTRNHPVAIIVVVCILAATMALVLRQSAQSPIRPARILDLHEWAVFGIRYIDLFCGVTVYEYLSGITPEPKAWPQYLNFGLRMAGVCILWGVLVLGRSKLRGSRENRAGTLTICYLTSLALFYVVAGSQALHPGLERYAICLVPPAVVLSSFWLSTVGAHFRVVPVLLLAIICSTSLVAFEIQYFAYIQTTGGNGHQTLRAAERDPKLMALESIVAEEYEIGPVWIVTDKYWCYWTIRYLSFHDPTVRVVRFNDLHEHPGVATAIPSGRVWFVTLDGATDETEMRSDLNTRSLSYTEAVIKDFGGKNVVRILHPSSSE